MEKLLFKFILYPFLFSLFVSSSVTLLQKSDQEEKADIQNEQPLFLNNLQLLKPFLSSPAENSGELIDPEDDLLKAVFIFNQALQNYNNNKLKEAEELLLNIDATFPFVFRMKKSLLAKLYYDRKNYNAALVLTRELGDQKSDDLQAIEILLFLLTGNRAQATETFKTIYLNRNAQTLKKIIPTAQLVILYNSLSFEEWFRRFNYLLTTNSYSEFRQESGWCPFEQLKSLFSAEFFYIQKNYGAALSSLNTINNERLITYRDRLRLKIGVRTKQVTDLISKLRAFQNNRQIYKNLLWDIIRIKYASLSFEDLEELIDLYLEQSSEAEPQHWQCRWLKGWLYYKLGRVEPATKEFLRISRASELSLKIAAIYWSNYFQKTEPAELELYPFSYYAVRVFKDNQFFQKKKTRFISLFRYPVSNQFLDKYNQIKKLFHAGFSEEALLYLRDILKSEQNTLNYTELALLKTIEPLIIYQQKKFQQAFIRFSQNFSPVEELVVPNFLARLIFPLEEYDLIQKRAVEFGLPVKLIMAIIRQESFFNHQAVSPANARGLMQLLPSTARSVAADLQINDESISLFDPEKNILLGIAYFKKLFNKYNQKTYLALAAYNAGESVVDSWLQAMSDYPEDVFIENIPFSETRNYVKAILRNKFFYEFYYGQD